MTYLQIAEKFSTGNFAAVYPYLSEEVEWHIPGQRSIKGKQAVIDNCEQTARYFDKVKPRFIIHHKIEAPGKVAVTGSAEWMNTEGGITCVQACDIYLLAEQKLQQIISYCVPEEKTGRSFTSS